MVINNIVNVNLILIYTNTIKSIVNQIRAVLRRDYIFLIVSIIRIKIKGSGVLCWGLI